MIAVTTSFSESSVLKNVFRFTLKGEVGRLEVRFHKVPISVDGPGGGVLPYIRYIGMCRPKGYGF